MLERFLELCETRRAAILILAIALVAAIALIDWQVQPNVSLGFLYFFPLVLAAGAFTRVQVLLLSAVCSVLREVLGPFRGDPGAPTRLVVVFAVFSGTGLLVSELIRNRRLLASHLALQRQSEEQMRVLAETSPLAILTLDGTGKVVHANDSARRLLGFEETPLEGQAIGAYLPVLERALRNRGGGAAMRTTVECRGRRRDGEVFLANIWFSTYTGASGPRLAAVVWDASETLRDREAAGLDSLLKTSGILVHAVSHELRNVASAAAAAYGGLRVPPEIAQSREFRTLGTLIRGLEQIAASGLRSARQPATANSDLHTVLDAVRIVMDPSIRESGVSARWEIPENIPLVRADYQSLLQVFLNLTRNSLRALATAARKEFRVEVAAAEDAVLVRFRDSGPGVEEPSRLFEPFQPGAEDTGLGLYLSRAILRSFDGDLRYETEPPGSCFVAELRRAETP